MEVVGTTPSSLVAEKRPRDMKVRRLEAKYFDGCGYRFQRRLSMHARSWSALTGPYDIDPQRDMLAKAIWQLAGRHAYNRLYLILFPCSLNQYVHGN